jgi:multidrug efflux system outer membrane protein
LVPVVNVNASATRTRTPNFFGSGSTNGNLPALTYNEFAANLGITSYEIDLFGRIRSLRRQALETYFATDAARKSAQIALVANVATAYLGAEEGAQQLAVSREMVKAARQTFDLTKQSFDAGVSSQFDLNTASTQLQNALVAESGYAQQLAQANDELAFLLGEPVPEDLAPSPKFDTDICLQDIPVGLPSDLIEQRPDIIEAEHQLKADNANIGAARAVFFPTITLTGSAGFASSSLQSLFEPASSAWSISPQLVWPVFASGTAYHELKAVEAAKLAQAAQYQSTVQNAFRGTAFRRRDAREGGPAELRFNRSRFQERGEQRAGFERDAANARQRAPDPGAGAVLAPREPDQSLPGARRGLERTDRPAIGEEVGDFFPIGSAEGIHISAAHHWADRRRQSRSSPVRRWQTCSR